MSSTPLLRIGTRGSPLALAQVVETRRRLGEAHLELAAEGALETVIIKTSGDIIQDRTLAEIGGKGLFVKEIDEALLDGRIDIAVHSMKDLPTWLPEGIETGAVLPREDARDALFCDGAARLVDLPSGAVVGTASLRRQAQVLIARPDLKVVPLRGNVGTRLRKLSDGEVDATLLALAGLKRLGQAEKASGVLEPEEMLPAVAQGAIAIACRAGDEKIAAWLRPLDHAETTIRVTAERACLAVLDGSCRTPIAAYAVLDGESLQLRALVALPDGSLAHRTERAGAAADAARLGQDAGEALRAEAGPEFFAKLGLS